MKLNVTTQNSVLTRSVHLGNFALSLNVEVIYFNSWLEREDMWSKNTFHTLGGGVSGPGHFPNLEKIGCVF